MLLELLACRSSTQKISPPTRKVATGFQELASISTLTTRGPHTGDTLLFAESMKKNSSSDRFFRSFSLLASYVRMRTTQVLRNTLSWTSLSPTDLVMVASTSD